MGEQGAQEVIQRTVQKQQQIIKTVRLFFCGSKTKVIFLQLKKILEMFWSLTTKWKRVLIWLEPNVIKSWFCYRSLMFSSLFPFSKTEYRMGKEEGRDKSHKILLWIVSNRCSYTKHRYYNYTFYSWTIQRILCVDERKCSAVKPVPWNMDSTAARSWRP